LDDVVTRGPLGGWHMSADLLIQLAAEAIDLAGRLVAHHTREALDHADALLDGAIEALDAAEQML
jgi:hypothetical protein